MPAKIKRPADFKVLVTYERDGERVSRSLYSGPHEKHADKAYEEACILGKHGILKDCTIQFFNGYRLRHDYEKKF